MTSISILNGSSLTARTQKPSGDSTSIPPCLMCTLDLTYSKRGDDPERIVLNFGTPTLTLRSNSGGLHYLGVGIPQHQNSMTLVSGGTYSISYRIELDQYKLKKIEELRQNKDLKFFIQPNLTLITKDPLQNDRIYLQEEIEIPKSDWVEKILPTVGYKYVSLIELPLVDGERFKKLKEHLDEAWKEYSMGDYKGCVTDCRSCLEEFTFILKEMKLTQKEKREGSDNEIDVPDFSHFSDDSDQVRLLKNNFISVKGFLGGGPHPRKQYGKEDAEFAMLTTRALVNWVVEKIK